MVGAAVLVVAFAWALPRFADYGQVWAQFGDLRLRVLPMLAVATALNLVAPSMSQMAALPGLRVGRAVATDWTTTAVTNLVPGGSALAVGLTWTMYRSFGLRNQAIAQSVVVTGVWDVLVKLGMPVVAVTWLTAQNPVDPEIVVASALASVLAAVAFGLLVVMARGPATASRLGSILDRLPATGTGWPRRLESIRATTTELLVDRWKALTWWTLVGHLNLYMLLVLCLRAVGLDRNELSWAAVLTAFAFGRLVTAVPLTPGGLGVMELGLIGALSTFGASASLSDPSREAAVVAGVLLFRFISFALPLPLGLVGWIWWSARRTTMTEEHNAPPNPPTTSAGSERLSP